MAAIVRGRHILYSVRYTDAQIQGLRINLGRSICNGEDRENVNLHVDFVQLWKVRKTRILSSSFIPGKEARRRERDPITWFELMSAGISRLTGMLIYVVVIDAFCR